MKNLRHSFTQGATANMSLRPHRNMGTLLHPMVLTTVFIPTVYIISKELLHIPFYFILVTIL